MATLNVRLDALISPGLMQRRSETLGPAIWGRIQPPDHTFLPGPSWVLRHACEMLESDFEVKAWAIDALTRENGSTWVPRVSAGGVLVPSCPVAGDG